MFALLERADPTIESFYYACNILRGKFSKPWFFSMVNFCVFRENLGK